MMAGKKSRKKSKAVKMFERARRRPPLTRAERALRSITINYREIPYNKLQFRLLDTLNDECLHSLVVEDANLKDEKFIKMAYNIFLTQAKEMQ